jgi:hypothetical protein
VRRLADVRGRLDAAPLRPPAVDAKALRFDAPPAVPTRILNLVAALGAVLTPDDAAVEPDAAARTPPPPPGSVAPAVELVVHSLKPRGRVGRRVDRLLKLRASHGGDDGDSDDGAASPDPPSPSSDFAGASHRRLIPRPRPRV